MYDGNQMYDMPAIVAVTDHVVYASVLSTLPEWQARNHDAQSAFADPGY